LGKLVQPIVECATRRPITRIFTNLGRNGRRKNPRTSALFMNNLGYPNEEGIDVANVAYDKAKFILKKIVGPHAFVENEQWSVVHMKKEFHAKFATIFQIIY